MPENADEEYERCMQEVERKLHLGLYTREIAREETDILRAARAARKLREQQLEEEPAPPAPPAPPVPHPQTSCTSMETSGKMPSLQKSDAAPLREKDDAAQKRQSGQLTLHGILGLTQVHKKQVRVGRPTTVGLMMGVTANQYCHSATSVHVCTFLGCTRNFENRARLASHRN
jgi:hypothetical protein